MKILVVGGVAGGASAAARIRRLDEEAEIIIFERGEHVSYSNCALPYYLGGVVEKRESLVLMTPEAFKSRHDIEVRTGSEVISIDRAAKTVTVRTSGGEEYRESYDKLILAPGADPVLPRSIKGIDRERVFTLRNVTDAGKIKDYMDAVKAKTAVVTGGGFIGIEVAENLREAGLKVSLVEGLEQIMSPFDYDMVQFLHKELLDNGVDLYLSGMVSEITDTGVRFTKDGAEKEISADVVVMCVGISPASGLAQAAGLEVNQRRFIRVNHNYQTSDPDIYAGRAITASAGPTAIWPWRAPPSGRRGRRRTISAARSTITGAISAPAASRSSASTPPAQASAKRRRNSWASPARSPMCCPPTR